MRIGFLDNVHPVLAERLAAAGHEVRDVHAGDHDAWSDLEGLVVRSSIIKADLLAAMPGLRFIARAGAGMENIDSSMCAERGIVLYNSPEGNRDGVGEWCVAQLLMLIKGLAKANAEVHAGHWYREANRGHDLEGSRVGIIGYGNMGRAFASKLSGFGVKVFAYDKYHTGFGGGHVAEASLDDVLAQSDAISLHLPLTEETLHYADAAFFTRIAKPAWFLNSSRGPVVHTAALLDALDRGSVRGAALDVLEFEKPDLSGLDAGADEPTLKRLLAHDRVLLTPHIAGVTHEAGSKTARVLADRILKDFPHGAP